MIDLNTLLEEDKAEILTLFKKLSTNPQANTKMLIYGIDAERLVKSVNSSYNKNDLLALIFKIVPAPSPNDIITFKTDLNRFIELGREGKIALDKVGKKFNKGLFDNRDTVDWDTLLSIYFYKKAKPDFNFNISLGNNSSNVINSISNIQPRDNKILYKCIRCYYLWQNYIPVNNGALCLTFKEVLNVINHMPTNVKWVKWMLRMQ